MEETDRAPGGERRGLYGQRPSASHDELVLKEFARIAAMSPRERMEEALRLDRGVERLMPGGGEVNAEGEPSR